jgi:hypothetical protein
VVDETGKAIGSIMIKDVKHLLTASDVNRDYMLVSGDLHCNSQFAEIVQGSLSKM